MNKIAKPFMVGLLLAPVGGLVGSIIVGICVLSFFFFVGSRLSVGELLSPVFVAGPIVGSVWALPGSAFILPLTYILLRQYSRIRAFTLVVVSLVTGSLSMLVVSTYPLFVHYSSPLSQIREDIYFIAVTTLVGGVTGAVIATIFAKLMRIYDPAAWSKPGM